MNHELGAVEYGSDQIIPYLMRPIVVEVSVQGCTCTAAQQTRLSGRWHSLN